MAVGKATVVERSDRPERCGSARLVLECEQKCRDPLGIDDLVVVDKRHDARPRGGETAVARVRESDREDVERANAWGKAGRIELPLPGDDDLNLRRRSRCRISSGC